MENRTLLHLQITDGQLEEHPKNVLDLNSHVESMKINLQINDAKICFYLSWKHPLNVPADDELSRHLIREKSTTLNNRSKELCKRFVTISKLPGRIGNQMFEIASVIGVAYSYDLIPIIPHMSVLNKYIDLPNRFNTSLKGLENVVNCHCRKAAVFYSCESSLNSTANVTMHGYLQSWKYFNDAEHIIRKVYSLKKVHIINARKFLDSVTTYGYQHVCIHVRRGDFLRKRSEGYTTAGVDFIERARNFYKNKYSKVDFVLVSNDKTWCRKKVKDVAISPFNNAGDDMALMTISDHVIVTSGTFGWWGAWLSRGTTVYFKGYPGNALSSLFNRSDYYPQSWIGL
ncbi:galactoside 2-alpha-L-fucosyltransferase Sec1-like [Mercenaria mercenaria]|uniref:galactoside 2-alpha-L-fucosyltransferase Sec1-like n=1 Tax=Mercenaria mercenaria TaxID=6596 RepID=UPI00234FA474|nr:galactoside 2-alpha-L-fucosyltransferase Sec1-like [Mercenaria mercenaria]